MSVSCSASATRCAVLCYHMLLRMCYAMLGTDLRYGATIPYGMGLRCSLLTYGIVLQCPVLTYRVGLQCTVLTYVVVLQFIELVHLIALHVSCPMLLRACYAMSGTELQYAAMRVLCDVRY
eukprot:1788835-Rhodomonas_salina.2